MTWIHTGWNSLGEMLQDFAADASRDIVPHAPEHVLWADYWQEFYEGTAFVVFTSGGMLYEVHGSHCSCYGLEDQWEPEETTIEALAMRKHVHPDLINRAWEALAL